jgi:hypothetical protein
MLKTKITELGVSTLQNIPCYHDRPLNQPLYALRMMVVHHSRMMENAHILNQKCDSHPEQFGFGQTRFETMEDGQKLLERSVRHSGPNNHPRPVVFLGHAVENDIEATKKQMQVDLNAHDVIAFTLDTQVMALEIGIAKHRHMGLKDVLGQF